MKLRVEKQGDIAIIFLPCVALDAGKVAEFKRDVAPLLEGRRSFWIYRRLRSWTALGSAPCLLF